MAVDTSVADEAQHMQFLPLGGRQEVCEDGILKQTTFFDGQVDFHQILVDNSPSTQIHMADLRVAHLPIRKTHGPA